VHGCVLVDRTRLARLSRSGRLSTQ
jgi:hypothetical protein